MANGNPAIKPTPSIKKNIKTVQTPTNKIDNGYNTIELTSAIKEVTIIKGIRGRKIMLAKGEINENLPKL